MSHVAKSETILADVTESEMSLVSLLVPRSQYRFFWKAVKGVHASILRRGGEFCRIIVVHVTNCLCNFYDTDWPNDCRF